MIANLGDLPYVIVIVVIVLVAGSQLPKIARNLGSAGKEFKKAQQEADAEAERNKGAQTADARDAALAPRPVGPVPAPASAAAPAGAQVPATAASADPPASESAITLSPAQLDALLKAREEQVRGEGANGSG